jgi:hypothetical protein
MQLNTNSHVIDSTKSILYNDATSHLNSTSPLAINMSSASSLTDNDDHRDSEIIQRFSILNESKNKSKNHDTNQIGSSNSPNSISSHCSNSTAGETTSSADQMNKMISPHHRIYSPPISNGSSSSIKSPQSCDESTSPIALLKMAKKELISMSPDRESRSSSHDHSSFICGKSDTSSSKNTQKNGRDNVIPQRKRRDFIPNELKDDSYWERRRKNNLAAKRSREKRRLNDIVLEAKVIELNKKHNILKFKLDLVMNKYQVNEDEVEVLYEENKHLFVNVQENLGLSELTNDSTQHNGSGDNAKDNDTANSSCSSINENHSSGDESGFTDSTGRKFYQDYNRHGPPQKKKIPSDDVFKPIELQVQENLLIEEVAENKAKQPVVQKEQSKSQYPLLYTQLCKAMNNRNPASNINYLQTTVQQPVKATNILQNLKTNQQQQQQQENDTKVKSELAAISLANLRSIMSNVSRDWNQHSTQFQPLGQQPHSQSPSDSTSQKLIGTLINEYFRHDKTESQPSKPTYQVERSSNLLNHQIEKYKSLINKTGSGKTQIESQQQNFVNQSKPEVQRSRKRNFQSVSKMIAEQQQKIPQPKIYTDTNADSEMVIKNTKYNNSADAYMDQLLAKYTQPMQRLLLNPNEIHVNTVQNTQNLMNTNISKMSTNEKYTDENFEVLNENLINLNQTAHALILQELKQQQQQQHQAQMNIKCISNTSPFNNSLNNSNTNTNNGDNMPLKLRFKMLQLKTGEVN